MASFDFDQAEGLRRMLAGPKPRIFTFLSAAPQEEKSAMLLNLSASLSRAGSDVMLVDAKPKSRGVAISLEASAAATLMEVARQERALNEIVQSMPEGFGIAMLTRGSFTFSGQDAKEKRRLDSTFGVLAKQKDIVVVDGELSDEDTFPISAMDSGEIVVQMTSDATSITAAYGIIKRLNAQFGRGPFGILVTGAPDAESQKVYENISQAASRYLGVQLNSMGSVPADDHMKRAARLGRAVIDAFPLARASIAFRRLAGRFTGTDQSQETGAASGA